MGNKFLFLHIPKNGGTSLRDLMSGWFPSERTCPYRIGQDYSANFTDLDLEKYDYFTGHIPAALAQKFFSDDMPKLTVLRHPVDRIYSQYAYWRAYDLPKTNVLEDGEKGRIPTLYAAELQGPLMAKRHSFGSFLFSNHEYIQRVLTNPQARYLCEASQVNKIGSMEPQAALDGILRNIEKMNITVAVLENQSHLTQTLESFAARLGIDGEVELPHSNKSERQFFDGLDEERVAMYLRQISPLDFPLYEHFRQQTLAAS